MKIKILLLLFLFLYGVTELRGDVYLLRDLFKRPQRSRQQYPANYYEGRLLELLDFKSLFDENISINGADGQLHVGLLNYTYNEFLSHLRGLELKNITGNESNTIITSGERRYLIYNAGEFNKAICFEFNIRHPANPPPLPMHIPNPGNGAIHTRIICFPDRGTTYVTFNTIFNAEDAFLNCAAQLRTHGINRIGGVNDSPTAGFFMNKNGTNIVLLSFNQEFNNGFIYFTEKKK